MKVIIILRDTPESADISGMARWLFNMVKAMQPCVERLDILGQHSSAKYNGTSLGVHCTRFLSVPFYKNNLYKLFWLRGWDYDAINIYNPDFIRSIREWSNQIDYDLAIFLGHGTNIYIPYVEARHKMMVPLDTPSGIANTPPKAISTKIKYFLNNFLVNFSEKSYNLADSVLVVSEKDRDLLINIGINKPVHVCPLSVDTTEFSTYSNLTIDKDKALLFTGVLDFYPNVDALQHLVHDIYLPANLLKDGYICRIAGRNPSQSVKELGKIKGVELLENKPDLITIFIRSMIYIAPMRVGLGMKTKILEAMAMSMPIVGYSLAFNGLSNPEQYAIVCKNREEIINSIRMLITNENLRTELGSKARYRAETKHSIQGVANFILDHAK
jgi:glycosyltransferase involved in cell wall biosynthesis